MCYIYIYIDLPGVRLFVHIHTTAKERYEEKEALKTVASVRATERVLCIYSIVKHGGLHNNVVGW